MPQIAFIKNHPNAKTPTQATEHAAGFDLYAAQIKIDYHNDQLVIDTGLNVAFDTGHVLLIYGRSGLSMKHGIRLVNCTGVVDSDYRGPLKVLLRSDIMSAGDMTQHIRVGDRIAQAILMPIPQVTWVEATELSTTERGENGFGSTGKS